MLWILKNIICCALFHISTFIHDSNLIAHVANNAKVVTDKQIGQIQFLLNFLHEVQHLSLYRYIECRHRFIRDD